MLKSVLPDHLKIEQNRDTDLYFYQTGKDLTPKAPDYALPAFQLAYEQSSLDALIDSLETTRRDSTPTEAHIKRLETELDYFDRMGLFGFLISLKNLILEFEKDGVVWGVGRGSACASYVLYLLGVHDINPITYDISFTEFSKELSHE
jgi:DNA polymerase III alpha subunit